MQAEALLMAPETVLLLGELVRRDLTQSSQAVGFSRRSGQQFPGTKAMQVSPGLALLARGAEQAALGVTEVTFELVVGTRQSFEVVTVEQARPVAGADFIQMVAESSQAW